MGGDGATGTGSTATRWWSRLRGARGVGAATATAATGASGAVAAERAGVFGRGDSDRGDDRVPDESIQPVAAEDPVETAVDAADDDQLDTPSRGSEPALPGFTSGDQDFGGSFGTSSEDVRPAATPPAASPSATAAQPVAATPNAPGDPAPPEPATAAPDSSAPPGERTAPVSTPDAAAADPVAAAGPAAAGADQQQVTDPAGDERTPTRSGDADGSASSGSSVDDRPAPTVTIDPETIRQQAIADLPGRNFVFSGAEPPPTGSTDTADTSPVGPAADAATPPLTGTHVETERDADDNLIASTSVTYDDAGNEVSRMSRTFDVDGNVTSAVTTTTTYSDDGALESRSTSTIENGVRVSSSREEYGSDGALTERSDTTYDAGGDAETRVEIYYGAGGVPDTQRTITFDDDGNAYQEDYQIADGRTGTSYQPGEHVRTTRNDDGTVTRETTRVGDDGQLDYRHVEVTDERGRPVSTAETLYGDDGEPTRVDEFTYRDGQAVRQTSTTYDDEGRYVENRTLDDNVEVTSSSRTSYDHEGNVTATEYTRYGPDGEVTYQGDEPPPAPDLSHLVDERVAGLADMDPTETTVAFGSALDGEERPTIDRDGLLAGFSSSSDSDDGSGSDDQGDSDDEDDDTIDLDEVAALSDDLPRDLLDGALPTSGTDPLAIGETEKHLDDLAFPKVESTEPIGDQFIKFADVGDPSYVDEMPAPKLYEPLSDIEATEPALAFPKVESTEPVGDEFTKFADVGDPSEVGEMPNPKLYEPVADIETVHPDIALPAVQQMPADPVAEVIDSQHDLTALDIQPVAGLGDVDLDQIADLGDGLDQFGG
jgi:hypothetical protein